MPKTTKKAERATLAKARRMIRRKLAAQKAAKGGGLKRVTKTHPHRKTSAMR